MSIKFGRSGGGYSSSEVMQTEDDDWRKIEDVAERRRIQNRLAQRNYRRKLRAKLEELEKKSSKDSEGSSKAEKSVVLKRPATQPKGAITSTSEDELSQEVAEVGRESTAEYDMVLSFGGLLGDIDSTFEDAFQAPISSQAITNQHPAYFSLANLDALFAMDSNTMPQSEETVREAYGKEHFYTAHPNPSESPHISLTSGGSNSNSTCTDLEAVPSLIPSDWTTTPDDSATSSPSTVSVSGPYQQAKIALLHAMANLTFPPGFAEVMPMSSSERETFHMKYRILQPTPDIRTITLKQDRIFNAGIINGLILSLDTLSLAEDETLSPFNQDTPIPEHIPRDLIPTALQRSIPHHPYIDIIPFPGFRDKMLRFMDLIDEDEVCHLMYAEWGVWGAVPWEKSSWEIGEKFAEKYWFLVDEDMYRSSDFWRAQRGLKPLKRYNQRMRIEQGRVVTDGTD